ncbi:MAG: hypothetical protein Q4D79_11050 [Propionibacteriaceae bacterium]|nr:hypothetical protein [Propionibacteriaceae bacterium]
MMRGNCQGGNRTAWPAHKPFGIHPSRTDWADGGWSAEVTARLANQLATEHGVSWADVSSGSLDHGMTSVGPGYQVPLAA